MKTNIKALALQGATAGPLVLAAQNSAEEYARNEPVLKRGFTAGEIGQALAALMSGPKATRPTWRALRKTIQRIRKGLDVSKGGWRSWPKMGSS